MRMEAIETKISAAFCGGKIRRRELRLTGAEADYVRAHCAARLVPMGGQWYEIIFTGSAG